MRNNIKMVETIRAALGLYANAENYKPEAVHPELGDHVFDLDNHGDMARNALGLFDKLNWAYPAKISDSLDFGDAIQGMKAGKRFARRGWNGMSMFVFYVPSDVPSSNAPYNKVLGDDQVVSKRRDFLMMRTANGDTVPWLASQSDMLECDWEEVIMPFDEGVHR